MEIEEHPFRDGSVVREMRTGVADVDGDDVEAGEQRRDRPITGEQSQRPGVGVVVRAEDHQPLAPRQRDARHLGGVGGLPGSR
jgi:hypothetical protein